MGNNGWILSIIFGWCNIMGMLGPRLEALGWVPLKGKKNVCIFWGTKEQWATLRGIKKGDGDVGKDDGKWWG
jgi:hypothetical protein